jgi:hypothetical protein
MPNTLAFVPSSTEDTTRAELAKLTAHIQTLPESQRRKLRKQLEDATALVRASASPVLHPQCVTPRSGKHARSKSIGTSIRVCAHFTHLVVAEYCLH